MPNVNIEAQSTSYSGIKVSKEIKCPRVSLGVTPCHISTDHYFVNEPERPLSTIEDPLWKHVCTEVQKLMPPLFVFRLSECQLGPLHSYSKQVDLYCPQGTVNSIGQYDFVILGCLQKFFPTLKRVRVKSFDVGAF